jgi:uncharacterized membrane protein YcaP (DUF421 family)
MEAVFGIDWKSAFVPSGSLWELVLRGTLMYFFLLAVLRVFRREAGGIGMTDILLIVIVADAAQNAMSDDYQSITEGVVLVGTIVFWDFALDWLGYRYPGFRRLIRPQALPLIRDGRIMKQNLKRELMSEEELVSQLREHGVEHAAEVKRCYLEGDGKLSVITRKSKQNGQSSGKEKKALH